MYPKDNPQKPQAYVIHCDACGFHKTTDGTDIKLTEIKTSVIPGGAPRLEAGKIVTPKVTPRLKKFKCPKCGRGVTARKSNVKTVSHIEEDENDKKDNPTGRETGSFGRAIPPDFTG